jgi:TRAP-type C4-dicarboxylate transport system substrate-binding protein
VKFQLFLRYFALGGPQRQIIVKTAVIGGIADTSILIAFEALGEDQTVTIRAPDKPLTTHSFAHNLTQVSKGVCGISTAFMPPTPKKFQERGSTMKKILYAIPFLALIIFAAGTAAAAPQFTLRFAGQLPEDHPATGLMYNIAGEIAEKTEGRVEVKVYPANQLGDYALVHQELVRGTIDMALISVPSDLDPRMSFVYIHGICKDYDDLERVFHDGGWAFEKMRELNANLGVRFLGFNIEGFMGVGSTKPLLEPVLPDVRKGVLCRIPNMPVFQVGAASMGFDQTVPLPYANLRAELQEGGGADAFTGLPPASAYTMLKDIVKYWHHYGQSIESQSYLMSDKTWEKLSADDREAVFEAVAKARAKNLSDVRIEDEKYLQLMREAGIHVMTYTESQLRPIRNAMAADWSKLSDALTKPFMDEFIEALLPR